MKNRFIVPLILSGFLFFFPVFVHAQLSLPGVPFGGLVVFTLPCTCPATAGNMMIFYAPMYIGSVPVPTGALTYVPYITQVFAWYKVTVPSIWHLGSFIPGAGNAACWIVNPAIVPPCIPMPYPSYGTISQVGTS